MAKPEMPKSFLNLIYALVVLAVPVFFAALFLGSAARKKKRRRAAIEAQLEALNIPLRNRCEAVLDALRTGAGPPGSDRQSSLLEKVQSEIALLHRAGSAQELCAAENALEQELAPWLESLPDSYVKRKLLPLQSQAQEAKKRYNAAVAQLGGEGISLFEV